LRIVSSLKTKIILSVSAILVVTIGTGTWINIGYQRAHMEDALEDNVLVISNTIEKSLSTAMLQGKSKEVQNILEAVGGYHNIRGIKIFSPHGVILKSSNRSLIGRKVDPSVLRWFQEGVFKKPIKRRREGIFSVLFPIDNSQPCVRCHGSHVKLNGILAVDISMAQTQAKLNELSNTMFLWALGVTLALAVSLSLFLTHFVTNPIQDLITTMERTEKGLEVRVQVKSGDDLGRLGVAFNSLLSKLELAKREVEKYHYEQMQRADRLASVGEMAAGIAHEIKNPLAGIAGVIRVLNKDVPAGDEKGAILQQVMVQVERMDKAVKNLLTFARPKEPKRVPVDVNELIGKLFDFLAPQFGKHGIVTERKLTPEIPLLALDPDLIQQAFLNIALNAIQAMQEGGTFSVETKMDDTTGPVKIVFTDTGKGIPNADLASIFNPFFTTRQQGTGLGLSITHRVIEQHNGKIAVESPSGKGARFTISLPQRL
jgi:two-component system NtrC family sensor kinase